MQADEGLNSSQPADATPAQPATPSSLSDAFWKAVDKAGRTDGPGLPFQGVNVGVGPVGSTRAARPRGVRRTASDCPQVHERGDDPLLVSIDGPHAAHTPSTILL